MATLLPCTTLSLYIVNVSEVYNADSSFIGELQDKVKAKAEAKAKEKLESSFFI